MGAATGTQPSQRETAHHATDANTNAKELHIARVRPNTKKLGHEAFSFALPIKDMHAPSFLHMYVILCAYSYICAESMKIHSSTVVNPLLRTHSRNMSKLVIGT